MIRIILNRSIINEVLLSIYLIFTCIYFIFNLTALQNEIIVSLLIFIGIHFLLYYCTYYINEKYIFELLSVFIIALFILINSLYNNYLLSSSFYYLLSFIAQIGVSLAIIKYRSWLIPATIIILLFVYIGNFYLQGLNHLELNEISRFSRNTFTVYSIALFVVFIFAFNEKSKKNFKWLPLFISIILVFISFMVIGRSGIISSLIILLATIFKYHKKIFLYTFSITVLVIPLFFLIEILVIYESLISVTNFGFLGFDTPRYHLYNIYLDSLDFYKVIIGSNVESLMPEGYWGGPHNSFISLHMHMGISFLLILFLIAIAIIKLFLKNQYYLLLLLISIIVRAFTDDHLIRGNSLNFALLMSFYLVSKKQNRSLN